MEAEAVLATLDPVLTVVEHEQELVPGRLLGQCANSGAVGHLCQPKSAANGVGHQGRV